MHSGVEGGEELTGSVLCALPNRAPAVEQVIEQPQCGQLMR